MPEVPAALVSRHLEAEVRAALSDTPVVLLNGARQTGKSTLAAQLVRGGFDAGFVNLDDLDALGAARSDPAGFLVAHGDRLVIDEVQRAPELFIAIKASVDRSRRAGRFLLTGSAAVLLLPRISESLAGRMQVLTLWPLSQGEIAGRREDFISTVFADRLPARSDAGEARTSVLDRALLGGYPEAVQRDRRQRRDLWFRSYVETILHRDVREIAEIERLTEMPRLLGLLAARAGAIVNMAEIARAAAVPHKTLTRYLSLLELIFIVRRIPSWAGELGRRAVRHPKLILSDTGLLASLLGVDRERFARDAALMGPLIENFVAMELMKQLGWTRTRCALHHYRTHAGAEVDLVLEKPDGQIVAIEVKTTSHVRPADFDAIRSLARERPRKFKRGIVLHMGANSVPFGENLVALPISSLWNL
jgi:predicted AAA+ superfamily ATPase